MKRFLDGIFGLDDELSIWVEERELGGEKAIYHRNKRYFVKIPEKINQKITLRLKGLGRKRFSKKGNLLLHVWLNKGWNVEKKLWISESFARSGGEKEIFNGEKIITLIVPKNSSSGTIIRFKNYGTGPDRPSGSPKLDVENRGNLMVRLLVYPDGITPKYGSFESLSTDEMFLEGWVYRKFDEIMKQLEGASLPAPGIPACIIADLFNSGGVRNIYKTLVDYLQLTHLKIRLGISNSMSLPGICERHSITQGEKLTGFWYKITIKEQFLDNPFLITAILVHELCHVIHSDKLNNPLKSSGYVPESEKTVLEVERTVDLLVFMFKMGQFQLRTARDRRLTLGYFNQDVFERIQVIVSRKLDSP